MLIMSNEAVRSRLDALISAKGEDYSSISRLIGRNAAYIQQFIKRGIPRRLSEGARKRIARYFGVAEEELGGPAAQEDESLASGFVLVQRFDVWASAGPCALADRDRATDHSAFPRACLTRTA